MQTENDGVEVGQDKRCQFSTHSEEFYEHAENYSGSETLLGTTGWKIIVSFYDCCLCRDRHTLSACICALFFCAVVGFSMVGRPIPQKYPLYWSALLMNINGYRASSLYFERKKADYMGEDLEEIYLAGDFERRGFHRVEFLKLFDSNGDCAPTKHYINKNEVLVIEDSVNTKLYYVIEGRASVRVPKPDRRKGKQLRHVAWVGENEFIGEMSMLDALDRDAHSIERTSVRVVAGEGGVTVYEWDLFRLRKFMWERQNQQVSNALQAYVCHDLRQKLRKNTDSMVRRKTTSCADAKD